MKVAFIGVGNMGRPMARNIARAGHDLLVFDSDAARALQIAAETGATAVQRVGDVGDVDFVITMLPDANAVRQVVLGDYGISSVVAPGTVIIDMSSSQPLITKEIGAALAARKIHLIDAPVSGGVERARAGTLTIMIGADNAAAVARAKPILACMGSTFFEVGTLGSGHAAKALNNIVGACNYAVLAEAMLVAERYGIDPALLIDIVNVSTGQSFASTVVMKNHVVPKTYDTGFKIGLISKDAAIASDLSSSLGCDAPIIRLAAQRWVAARDALGSESDNSLAITAWRKK